MKTESEWAARRSRLCLKAGVTNLNAGSCSPTSRAVLDGLECVGPLKTADDIVTEKIDLGSGVLALPPGPGLGVALDEAKLARYRFA